MDRIVIEIPDNEWWTSNRRARSWRVSHAHTAAVKKRAHVIARRWRNEHPTDFATVQSWQRVHVTALIWARNTRFDPPNASPMVKAIIDAMTECDYWADDDWQHVVITYDVGGILPKQTAHSTLRTNNRRIELELTDANANADE